MNVKRLENNSYDRLEKFQSWRLYNHEIKPKASNYKVPSLSPKQKENFHFSPSKLGKIGNNIINSLNFKQKNTESNVLPSSGGYIYLNNNHKIIKEKNKITGLNAIKNVFPENDESKEIITDLHDNTFSYKDSKLINENIDKTKLHNCMLIIYADSYQENVERYTELTLDMIILSQHLKFLEIWVDLEIVYRLLK